MPAVGVVVPVRDRAAMVVEAIASVLAQTASRLRARGRRRRLDGRFGGRRRGSARSVPLPARACSAQLASGVAAARNAGAAARSTAPGSLSSTPTTSGLPTKLAAQMAWLAARPTYRIAQTGERWLDDGRHRNPRASAPQGGAALSALPRALPREPVGRRDPARPLRGARRLRSELRRLRGLRALASHRPPRARRARPRAAGREAGRPRRISSRARPGASIAGGSRRSSSCSRRRRSRADERAAVRAILRAKCDVLADGAARRGRDDEAARYRAARAASGTCA